MDYFKKKTTPLSKVVLSKLLTLKTAEVVTCINDYMTLVTRRA